LLLLALIRPLSETARYRPIIPVLLGWIALVIVFFSLSPGKRGVYLLPALPMLAMILAPLLSSQKPAGWFPPLLTGLQFLLGIALMAVGVLAWNDHPRLVEKVADYSTDPAKLHEAGTFVFVIGLAWLITLFGFWRSRALGRLFLAMMITWLLLGTWGYRILEPLRTPHNVLATAEQHIPPGGQLGMIDFREQFLLFSKRDFTHFSFFTGREQENRNAWLWMSETVNSYLLVADQIELSCFTQEGAVHLGTAHRDSYLLLTDEQTNPSCAPPHKGKWFTTHEPGSWQD
jgi:4-amino-4-deoxy-L-arabinose transferase-like glycosyltransferase